MAPYHEDPEHSRPYYQQLARLREELADAGIPPEALRHLSMGMTQDFEVAIEEGATIVRIGTAIFGPRPTEESEDVERTTCSSSGLGWMGQASR